MNLTDNERIEIAQNRLKTFDGFENLRPDIRKTLIDVFGVGMLEMEILDTKERLLELTIQKNNILSDGK